MARVFSRDGANTSKQFRQNNAHWFRASADDVFDFLNTLDAPTKEFWDMKKIFDEHSKFSDKKKHEILRSYIWGNTFKDEEGNWQFKKCYKTGKKHHTIAEIEDKIKAEEERKIQELEAEAKAFAQSEEGMKLAEQKLANAERNRAERKRKKEKRDRKRCEEGYIWRSGIGWMEAKSHHELEELKAMREYYAKSAE